jgi:type I restriction enzyme S subunit
MSNIPELRFKEFSGEWEEKKLGSYGKLINGLTYSPNDISDNGLLVLRSSNIQNYQLTYEDNVYVNIELAEDTLIKENDILICVRNGSKRLIGKSTIIPKNIQKATHGAFMTVFRSDNNKFIFHWFQTTIFYKQVHKNLGATINSINGNDLKKFKTIFPQKQEQQKIASFLTSIDKRIEQLTKKIELQENYKKGVMQKIFSQDIRFKKDDGSEFEEWEEKRLKDVLFEHKERNTENKISEVFSVAKTKGVVNQVEHLGRSYSAIDLRNYKIVFPNDIVYTKSPTSDFPFGIIKQNKLNRIGVVSTLYAVFKPLNKYIGSFLDYYFSSWVNTYNYLNPLVHKGAKNTMNINNSDFLNGAKISMPTSEIEQTKIANFLSSIDKKIEFTKQQLEKTKEFKRGLLQRMFV